ncbi:class I SAM-dependent methyltransferase [Candidatus Woesearchaeota archaeon]|nr:class I SAM-dependent methyltransferase [Candidatus Woesearchaeota archaeon]
MKILKEKSRQYKGNAYFKYKVNIPVGAISRAQLNEGEDLQVTSEPGQILLSRVGAKKQEFDGVRSQLYKEALEEFPNTRENDIKCMKKYLSPKDGERILEIGAGSGFFSQHILDLIGEKGRLIVSDPSLEQLEAVKKLNKKNIDVIQFVQFGSETVNLEKDKVDAIWSFGTMHHLIQKTKSFENMDRVLKKNRRVVICDVFQGSKLAKHFDDKVAKYCIVGHEVSFLSREYAETLCYLVGFEKPKFYDVNMKWKFKNKKDIGLFLYKLHGMTKTTPEECLKGAEEILGIEKKGEYYLLDWPLTVMTTRKK